MTRVLMITSRSDHGGGPKHVTMLLETMGSEKNPVFFVAAPASGYYFDLFRRQSQDTIAIPSRRFSLLAFLRLCRFVQENRIDIVHSHGRGAGYYARLARLLLPGLKVVHTHHGFYYQRLAGIKRLVLVGMERVLSKFTNAFIFVSESEREMAAQTGLLDASKSFLIPNGVPFVPWKERAPQPSVKRLLTVTRLEPEKGNHVLIHIAAELCHLRKDFLLSVAGDGPERPSLEALARDLGVGDHIRFLGYRTDVPRLLVETDVFVSSSLGEAQGLAVVEAMMQGVPVVVSRVLGHVDVVDAGRTGLMFDLEAPREAALHLNTLLLDPELWQRVRRNAYEEAKERFRLESMAQATEAVYRQVLSSEG